MNLNTVKQSIRKKMMILTAVGVASIGTAATFIIANANFSGDWKLNEQKSVLGEFGGRTAAKTMKIEGKDQSISIERHGTNFQGEAVTTKEVLTFDGKETESTAFGNSKKKSTAKWSEDGQALTINSTIKFERNGETTEIKTTEVWKLVDDGKGLSIESTSVSPRGTNTIKLVYDKAGGGA